MLAAYWTSFHSILTEGPTHQAGPYRDFSIHVTLSTRLKYEEEPRA